MEISGIIKSEHPAEHWGFLSVKDKKVLDLGCGINSEFVPTPYFFLQESKAKSVVGVDSNPQSYQWFKQNYNVRDFILYMDFVDRYEKIEMYLKYHRPEVVKIDIEGSEVHLLSIDSDCFQSVEQIAVEYHNKTCLVALERILKENNYNIKYFRFEHIEPDHQGVVFGFK